MPTAIHTTRIAASWNSACASRLPWASPLAERLKWGLRDIDGDYSNRYRAGGPERAFEVGGHALVPYAHAEVYYNTRYDAWNRQRGQAGVDIALNSRWRIEPFLAKQDDSRTKPGHIDAVGPIFRYFHQAHDDRRHRKASGETNGRARERRLIADTCTRISPILPIQLWCRGFPCSGNILAASKWS